MWIYRCADTLSVKIVLRDIYFKYQQNRISEYPKISKSVNQHIRKSIQ
jgi:hypothetical protein